VRQAAEFEVWRADHIGDPVAKLRYLRQAQGITAPSRYRVPVGAIALVLAAIAGASPVKAPLIERPRNASTPANPGSIWLAETRDGEETWSNGLLISIGGAVRNRPREVPPVGIVFHTTESPIDDLKPQNARRLTHVGASLLHYVRDERAYHYLIDRFGRVARVVEESDVAFHAGNSIWGDWINLNESFLAVSIESATAPGDGDPVITEPQIRAARLLTDMLRSKYKIDARNCVTHAQVSVNPSNFRIGWHTDWAGNFPFEQIGLGDNYALPITAVERYGFSYDGLFFASTGARMWRGVVAAEDRLRSQASQEGISVAALRARLRNRYLAQIRKDKTHHEQP